MFDPHPNLNDSNRSSALFSNDDFDPDLEDPDDEDIARFNDTTNRCHECGALIYDDIDICPKCGAAQESRYSFSRRKRRQAASSGGTRGLYKRQRLVVIAAILVVLGFLLLTVLGIW